MEITNENKLQEFRNQWVGRIFECKATGEKFTIPDDVQECDFYKFGECMIDVGRYGFYSRWGGPIKEITDE